MSSDGPPDFPTFTDEDRVLAFERTLQAWRHEQWLTPFRNEVGETLAYQLRAAARDLPPRSDIPEKLFQECVQAILSTWNAARAAGTPPGPKAEVP